MVYVLHISDLPKERKAGKALSVEVNGKRTTIALAEQKTGFGTRKLFMCPHCGARRMKLYYVRSKWCCTSCGEYNPYYGIQNTTRGGYLELHYRMERFAKDSGIEIKKWPFSYLDYMEDPRVGRRKFQQALKILQALENMRFQDIFFHRRYSSKTIKRVLDGTHPLLWKSLYVLRERILYF